MPTSEQAFVSDVKTRLESEQELALSDSRKASTVGWLAVLGSIAGGALALEQAPRFLTAGIAVIPAVVTALQREFKWAEWRDWHWDYVDRLDSLLIAAKFRNVALPELGARLEALIIAKTPGVAGTATHTAPITPDKPQRVVRQIEPFEPPVNPPNA